LQSGVLDVAARTEAIDWILKVDSVFVLLILMVFACNLDFVAVLCLILMILMCSVP
jgi:hypothetical protein